MDNFFRQKGSNTQPLSGFFARLKIFNGILPLMRRSANWLTGFIRLTEEEQKDAGIFIGDQRYK